ncbi:MAG: O-antigen polymerase [Ilumatobacteraceae bacterium]
MTPSPLLPLLTIIVGATTVLHATRARRGPLLTPITTTMFILVSIFGFRPLFAIADDMHRFYGIDVKDHFNAAARIGFVAVTALSLGYFLSSHRTAPTDDLSPRADRAPVAFLRMWPSAIVALGMVAGWMVMVAAYGGGVGFVVELFRGRSPDTQAGVQGMPIVVSTLPTSATIVVAAARIQTERTRRLWRGELLAFWATVAVSCIPPLALGNRRFLLPSVLAVGLALCLPKWDRRVALRTAVLSGMALLVLVTIPYVRSEGSRRESDDFIGAVKNYVGDEGVTGAFGQYFLSYDTEMFGYVSYLDQHLGNDLDHGYGRWAFGDLALAPLPATMVDSLGLQSRSDEVMASALREGCTTRSCPVPSLPGVLLSDFGELGVAVGLFLVGLLFARFDRGLRDAGGARLVAWLTLGGAAPALMRGNTVNQLWLTANIYLGAALAMWAWARLFPASVARPLVDHAAADERVLAAAGGHE